MPLVSTLVLVLAAVVVVPAEALAQSVEDQLQHMQDELERMRTENARMQVEIDELKAADTDPWVAQQRAEEIRALVADTLADADARAASLQGVQAGWSEHFYLASPDGRFKLQFEGQLQFRWLYNYMESNQLPGLTLVDRNIQGFENTRTRLTFRGHVFNRDMQYLVRLGVSRVEAARSATDGTVILRDAWIKYALGNDWSVRVGTFKLPYNREELVASARQLAVERSLVNESMNLDRGQGVEFTYARDTTKLMLAISDGAVDNFGGFMTVATGMDTGNTPFGSAIFRDVEWSITGRHEWLVAGDWEQFADLTSKPNDPFGVMIGLAGHAQTLESGQAGARDEHEWYNGTLDISIEWGGANAFGSVMYAYVDGQFGNIQIFGAVAQAGVYFTPKLEGFARFEYGWWDAPFDVPALTLLTFGTNYYLDGHDVKWSTDLGFGISVIDQFYDSDLAGYRMGSRDSEPQVVFRTQFQLLF